MNSKSYTVMAFMMTMVICLPAQHVDIEDIWCGQPFVDFIANICHGRTESTQLYSNHHEQLINQCCITNCSSFQVRNFYCPREIVEVETFFTATKPVTYPSRRIRSGGPGIYLG